MASGKERLYSEEEAEQILRSAARSPMAGGGVSRDRLLEMASELGISADAVLHAEREIVGQNREAEDRRQFRKFRWQQFSEHLVTYLSVNAFLLFINLRSTPGNLWFYWPLLGWGIGIAAHAFSAIAGKGETYEREYRQWRKTRVRELRRSGQINEHPNEILENFFQNHAPQEKIAAVKELREHLGLGLSEAKATVDAFYVQQGW